MGRQRPFLAVCIENLIRFKCLTESLNVSDDGHTAMGISDEPTSADEWKKRYVTPQ